MSERVACSSCGKWMFHLAKTCPHCGAAHGAPVAEAPAKPSAAPVKPLQLTPEEARALLSVSGPSDRTPGFTDVVADLVMPKEDLVDRVLSLVALPATALTVAVLGWGLVQARRAKREANLRGARLLAVPTASAFLAVLLWQLEAPSWVWLGLGGSLLAYAVREVLRARARPDLFT